ncbi:hypothetical protein BD413DRAFT_564202 [Trametes elegans]|nr:hypothetical protein BD413DRAFT_564202 [Trametes elegans]
MVGGIGPTLGLFASAGMVNAYGAFQDYYGSTLLPSSSSSSISLIVSLHVSGDIYRKNIRRLRYEGCVCEARTKREMMDGVQ